MAYSLSPNLKLRIDTNLTANAKYNLLKLDELGSLAATSSASGTVQLTSQYDLFLNANDSNQGGTGRGGNIVMGSPDNQLDTILLNASQVLVNGGFGFQDQSVLGTNSEASALTLAYFSNLSGSQDPEDVVLKLDLENRDREFILGGNLRISGNLNLTAPSGASSIQLPASGTLATVSGTEVLTNKILDATQNTLQNISYSSLASGFLLPGNQVLANFPGQAVKAQSLELGSLRLVTSPQQGGSFQLTLPATPGQAGQVLGTDGTGVLSWVSKSDLAVGFGTTVSGLQVSSQTNSSGFTEFQLKPTLQQKNQVWAGPLSGDPAFPSFRRLEHQDISHIVGKSGSVTWLPGQGAELVIRHNWGTRSVIVQIFDNLQWEGLDGPTVRRVDLDTVRITSQLLPPAEGWTVLLQAVL